MNNDMIDRDQRTLREKREIIGRERCMVLNILCITVTWIPAVIIDSPTL